MDNATTCSIDIITKSCIAVRLRLLTIDLVEPFSSRRKLVEEVVHAL